MLQLPWPLPETVQIGLRWFHFLALVAWIGAIFVIHLILRPQVAARGIPAPFLKLAWPAMATIFITGSLLTLSRISDLSALTTTRWGLILGVKTLFFLGMVTVASYDTFYLSPRLRRLSAAESESQLDQTLLKQGDGQKGRPVYVAYRGRIYDLSSSTIWRRGLHMVVHQSGQDLTQELAQAPHGEEMLSRFPQLRGYPEAPLAYRKLWRRFKRLSWVVLGLGLAALLAAASWY